MASSDDIDASIRALTEEAAVLSKVCTRNCNQHGKSKLFGYLRRASKTAARYLHAADVLALSAKAVQCLRTKSSQRDINASARILQQLRCMQRSTGEVVFCSLKAYVLLHISLRKKLYVPLFSMLLALSARFAVAAANVYRHAEVQASYVASHLRSVAATHRQHATLLEAVLQQNADHAVTGANESCAPKVSGDIIKLILDQPQAAWIGAISLADEGGELDEPFEERDIALRTAFSAVSSAIPANAEAEAVALPRSLDLHLGNKAALQAFTQDDHSDGKKHGKRTSSRDNEDEDEEVQQEPAQDKKRKRDLEHSTGSSPTLVLDVFKPTACVTGTSEGKAGAGAKRSVEKMKMQTNEVENDTKKEKKTKKTKAKKTKENWSGAPGDKDDDNDGDDIDKIFGF